MKRREGFVSNSSSASYIVKIQDITSEDFFGRLGCTYGWSELNFEAAKNRIINRLREIKDAKIVNAKSDRLSSFYKYQIDNAEESLAKAEKVDEDDTVQCIKFILECYDIR